MVSFLFLSMTFFPFRCKLCEKILVFTSDAIDKHLVKCHSISLTDYRRLYLVPPEQPPGSEQMEAELSVEQIEGSAGQGVCEEKSCGIEEGDQSELLAADQENEDTLEISDDPNCMCQLKCNICGVQVENLDHHVKTHHSVDVDAFRMLYPEKLFFRKTHHR